MNLVASSTFPEAEEAERQQEMGSVPPKRVSVRNQTDPPKETKEGGK